MNTYVRAITLPVALLLVGITFFSPSPASAAEAHVSIANVFTNGIKPAATLNFEYGGASKAKLQVLTESGKVVGSIALGDGGGTANVSFAKLPKVGFYTAQIVGADGTIVAKSKPFFIVTSKHSLTTTLDLEQTISDGGVDITLESIDFSTRKPTATFTIFPKSYAAASYSARVGQKIGGFSEFIGSTSGISIKVKSVSSTKNTVKIVITTEQKG